MIKQENIEQYKEDGFLTIEGEPTNKFLLLDTFSTPSLYNYNEITKWGKVDYEKNSKNKVVGAILYKANHYSSTPLK